jgi:threonine aldolase
LKKITEERKSLLACLVRQVGLLVEPVETNILIFFVCNDQALIEIKAKYFHQFYGTWKLRIVTHLDYREVMHTYVLETLSKLEM